MTKLSDTQLVILSSATQRDDCAAEVPSKLTETAAKKAINPLLKRGLLEETSATAGMPVWRRDEALGSFALVITRAGLDAIGVAPEETDATDTTAKRTADARKRQAEAKARKGGKPSKRGVQSIKNPRDGTKLSSVVKLLQRKNGASIAELTNATGWLPHTTRAALTGLRKRGFDVEKERRGEKASYRLVSQPAGKVSKSASKAARRT
jgi:hypothetical protein